MITKFKLYEDKNYVFFSKNIFDAVESLDYSYIIEYFKDGQDPNVLDHKGDNLMIIATNDNNKIRPKMIKILIDNGVDVNFQDENMNTPLIYCSYYFEEKAMKMLIDAGADWTQIDDDGNDFMYYVIKKNKKDFITWLVDNYSEKYQYYLKTQKRKEFNL